MKQTLIQDKFTEIDDKFIMESHPDVVVENNLRDGLYTPPAPHPFRKFMQSGWAAAIACMLVSGAVLSAVVAAGRLGSGDPGRNPTINPGHQLVETGSSAPIEKDVYVLSYISNGDGTCRVKIVTSDHNKTAFDVVIPEKSPDGDTVVALESDFDTPFSIPTIMTVEDFETYILAPLETHFGITVEEAKAGRTEIDDSQFADAFTMPVNAFALLKALSPFIHRSAEDLPEDQRAELLAAFPIAAVTDIYFLEPTLTPYDQPQTNNERHFLYNTLLAAGFTTEQHETINDHIKSFGSGYGCDDLPSDINSSAYIRSVTLPATITTLYDNAFNGWSHLSEIRFAGTTAEWEALCGETAWLWYMDVTIHCSDGSVTVGTELPEETP